MPCRAQRSSREPPFPLQSQSHRGQSSRSAPWWVCTNSQPALAPGFSPAAKYPTENTSVDGKEYELSRRTNERENMCIKVTNKYEILTNYEEDETYEVDTDKTKTKRTRRGIGMKGYMKRQSETNIKMFSTNGAGVVNKISSLKAQVRHTNTNVITLQETHCKFKGKIQIEGFVSFEAIRKKKRRRHNDCN